MKNLKYILVIVAALCAVSYVTLADDQKPAGDQKPIPYPLKTCLVCGMELGMMDSKPYVFVYKGQEIKVCDESEKKIFDKDPDKYMKKLADAEAKLKK